MHSASSGQLLSNINTRPLHWLWPQRIPFAHLTFLYGQPGSGLSLIALHLAACVSSGRTLPDDLPCPQGNVILIAPFDIPAYTIKPRLENAAADTSHIFLLNTIPVPSATPSPDPVSSPTPFYNPPEFGNPSFSYPPIPTSSPSSPSSPSTTERPFSLAHDFAHLAEAIQRTSARLVIIDSPDICRDQLMRPLLPRLTQLARDTNSAILLIRPLNRPLSTPYEYDNIRKTLQRMTQSGELISPARGLYSLPSSSATTSVPTVPIVPTILD